MSCLNMTLVLLKMRVGVGKGVLNMIRYFSCWFGLFCIIVSVINLFFLEDLPLFLIKVIMLNKSGALALGILGVFLVYFGRYYLPSIFFDSDFGDDDS